MKKLLSFSFAFIFLFLLIIPNGSFAQEQTGTQEQSTPFELSPPQSDVKNEDGVVVEKGIDDVTERVTITFPELEGSGYKVCLRNDYCLSSSVMREAVLNGKFDKYLAVEIDNDDIYEGDFEDLKGNSITVCGDSESSLKTKDCAKDEGNYFHAGKHYIVTVFKKQKKWITVGRAGFYVNHHMPKTKLDKTKKIAPEIFNLSIILDKLSKDGKKNSNNFQIVFEGPGIKEEICTRNLKVDDKYETTLPSPDWLNDKDNKIDGKPIPGLIAGKYTVKVNEQINENTRKTLRNDNCQGGYTFIHYYCSVDNKKETVCKEEIDPNQSDAGKFAELLDALASRGKGVPLPCQKGYNVKNPLDCNVIDTAIGPIALNPVGFITSIFSIVLSIGGLGALLLIIYSGYKILVSRGNKESIQGARETITAAILGLLFIVFSLVILSVITGDILKIPGFN